MRTALTESDLYFGDNGRIFCGSLRCSGMSAHYTGLDLSGKPVRKVTPADVRGFNREMEKYGVEASCACEGCGKRAPAVSVVA